MERKNIFENKSLFFLMILFLSTLLLLGCTDNVIPYTACQMIARSFEIDGVTSATCSKFMAGDYNNLLVGVGGPDGNSLQLFDVNNFNMDVNVPWDQLIDFPAGCGDKQAVKIVGSSLVCIDLDHNNQNYLEWSVAGHTIDENINMNNYYINDLNDPVQDQDAATKLWTEILVSRTNELFYLTDIDSGIGGYKDTNLIDPDGSEDSNTSNNVVNDQLLLGWISPEGQTPPILIAGLYDLHVHAENTQVGSKDARIYFEIIEHLVGGGEIILVRSEESGLLGDKEEIDIHANLLSDWDVNDDSRVVGKVYVDVSGGGGGPDITLYYAGNTAAHFGVPTNEQVFNRVYLQINGSTSLTGNWSNPDFNITAQNLSGINTGDFDSNCDGVVCDASNFTGIPSSADQNIYSLGVMDFDNNNFLVDVNSGSNIVTSDKNVVAGENFKIGGWCFTTEGVAGSADENLIFIGC